MSYQACLRLQVHMNSAFKLDPKDSFLVDDGGQKIHAGFAEKKTIEERKNFLKWLDCY